MKGTWCLDVVFYHSNVKARRIQCTASFESLTIGCTAIVVRDTVPPAPSFTESEWQAAACDVPPVASLFDRVAQRTGDSISVFTQECTRTGAIMRVPRSSRFKSPPL